MDNTNFNLKETRKNLVAKNNKLIQNSRYSLSLIENKALLFIISQIQPGDEIGKIYHFNISEFQQLLNWSQDSPFQKIKKMLKKLGDMSIWINDEQDGKNKDILLRWFDIVHMIPGDNDIELSIHQDMFPYLIQLKKKLTENGSYFTSYKLENVSLMKHKFSIRIYELLKSYQYNNKKWTFENGTGTSYDIQCRIADTVEDPKTNKPISIVPKTWANWAAFKRDVLDPSVEEINRYTDIKVKYVGMKEDIHHKKTRAIRTIVFLMVGKTDTEMSETSSIIDAEYDHIEDEKNFHQMTFEDVENGFFEEHEKKKAEEKDILHSLVKEQELTNSNHPLLYEILTDQGGTFSNEQIDGLYEAAISNLHPGTISIDSRDLFVTDMVTYYYSKVRATNEDTRTKPYNRLLDMVKKDYELIAYKVQEKYRKDV